MELCLVANSDTATWYLHPCRKVLSPIYAQFHVGSIITILPDSVTDFEFLNK